MLPATTPAVAPDESPWAVLDGEGVAVAVPEADELVMAVVWKGRCCSTDDKVLSAKPDSGAVLVAFQLALVEFQLSAE